MAPLAWTALALGLTSLAAGSPLRARQDDAGTTAATTAPPPAATTALDVTSVLSADDSSATDPATSTTTTPSSTTTDDIPRISGHVVSEDDIDVEAWCETIDLNDPEKVIALWEDKSVGVWLHHYLSMLPNGGDDWVYNITREVGGDTLGDSGISGCGVVDGRCDLDINCTVWTAEYGQPRAYWALKAVESLQSKLDVAHSFMMEETMSALLSIEEIKKDFAKPETEDSIESLAGIISSALFVVGGVAGIASVAASYVGAAAASGVGIARAAIAQANARKQLAGKANAERMLAAVEKKAELSADGGRASGAFGGSTYLLGSTFSTISAATDPDGQVPAGLLEGALSDLFDQARKRLEEVGKLATGQGGDYSLLPHQEGIGGLIDDDSYIAGFFSNGRMLFGEANDVFKQDLETTFATFRSKLVDTAMKSSGFIVFSIDAIDEGQCGDSRWAGYGSQWIDDRCFSLFREGESVDYEMVEQDMLDLIQDKYGFDLREYYMAAYECNKSDAEGGQPDLFDLPEDNSLPACFYNIEAKKVALSSSCIGSRCDGSAPKFDLSDF